MRPSPRSVRTYTAGVVIAAALAAAPVSSAFGADRPHIENFGQVGEHYYRGAQPKGDDFRALSAMGIKLVIDLAQEGDVGEDANVRAAGMRFVRIPMTTHQVPSPVVIEKFLTLVSDPANQPVYVHCIGGRHRTGVMTAIYRMTIDGWNAARAFNEMKLFKFGADFLHPEFKGFIETYVPAFVPAEAAAKERQG
jgi:tyrosine-protein phosphatase SIW14